LPRTILGGIAGFGAGAFFGGSIGGIAGGIVGAGIGSVNGRGTEDGFYYGLGLGFSVGAITGGIAGVSSFAYGDFLFNGVDFSAFGSSSAQRFIYKEAYLTTSKIVTQLKALARGPQSGDIYPGF